MCYMLYRYVITYDMFTLSHLSYKYICKQDNMIVHTCVICYMHILYIAYVACGTTLTTRLDLYLYVCRLLFLLGSNLELKKLISRPRDYSVLKTVARATSSEFYIRKHGIRDILAIGGQFVPLLSGIVHIT